MTLNPNNIFAENEERQLLALFELIGKKRTIEAADIIVLEGQKVDFFWIVLSGCFRAFRWFQNEEVTVGFSFKGDFDTSPFAYIHGTPTKECIEALQDSEILVVRKNEFEKYFLRNPIVSTLTEKLLSNYIEILTYRSIESKILTAEQRYLKLLQRQPKEASLIPLKYMASYLGISKERLSRIRKKIS
ncbi:MAG: Crp/Fnr family transcriptional regulator [Cyclobacteriaceae bacterium]|nr:Crp/Fnr family transcriptional regulator [Cyclobacteriaceae bacterium]